ncbi:MAG: ATP-NAD kinase [Pyrobaculum sp. JCHS_4]|nr:MAG: ATP-NAD kinase [Pyrobaculum sp. JCHS_4]
MFAVYYRPDLRPLAEEFKSRYGAVELTCGGELSHVFILGGDGTLLEALRRFPCVLDSVVVHLGMGRVNFYRSAEFTIPVEEAVEKIRRGEYRVLEFSTLEHDGCRALNEISIHRGEPGRLLSFRMRTDEGEVVGRADGVIISTPHGSSGYVVSTFGPVVDYRAEAVVISFIAPYTLFLRPIVLVSSQVTVETAEDAVLVCDGRETRQGRSFLVKRGGRKLKLAVFGEFQFLHRVMERLRSL